MLKREGHSRWFRLQALAAAAGVQFDHVSDFGVRRAMTDPELCVAHLAE